MMERLSVVASSVVVLAALLACRKADKEESTTIATSAAPVATPAASSAEPTTSAAPAATSAAVASASVAKAAPTAAKCSGLWLHKRCAKECAKDDDCADPKERCESYSGFDDKGENVQGAQICVFDANNTPRAVKPPPPVIGAPLVNGDCAKGYLPSVTEASKCDKECKSDAECGAGNICKAVGPVGIGKQCQKK